MLSVRDEIHKHQSFGSILLWGQFCDLALVDFLCLLYSDPQDAATHGPVGLKNPAGPSGGGFIHLEKFESQWEGLSHILWKIKNA
jgi:hypothetical protein